MQTHTWNVLHTCRLAYLLHDFDGHSDETSGDLSDGRGRHVRRRGRGEGGGEHVFRGLVSAEEERGAGGRADGGGTEAGIDASEAAGPDELEVWNQGFNNSNNSHRTYVQTRPLIRSAVSMSNEH